MIAYFDCFLDSFDASRVCHCMGISGHLTETQMRGETRLTGAGGWLKRWLHWKSQGGVIYWATSDCMDSPFICVREEVNYERRVSYIIAMYERWNDCNDFDTSYVMPDLGLCCMDRPLDYCWYVSFLSACLKQQEFEVCFRKDHFDPRDRVLLRWHNVEVFAVRPFKWSQFYIGVNNFGWNFHYGHRFLLISTPFVSSFYSHLAFNPCYCSLLQAAALTKLSACAFLQVLNTAYRGVSSISSMCTALPTERVALSLLMPTLLDVVRWLWPPFDCTWDGIRRRTKLNGLWPAEAYQLSCSRNADLGGKP